MDRWRKGFGRSRVEENLNKMMFASDYNILDKPKVICQRDIKSITHLI